MNSNPTPITPESLAALKALWEKKTSGRLGRNIRPASKYPMIFAGRNTHVAKVIATGLSESEIEANCDLIVELHNAFPSIVAALEAGERIRKTLDEIERLDPAEYEPVVYQQLVRSKAALALHFPPPAPPKENP